MVIPQTRADGTRPGSAGGWLRRRFLGPAVDRFRDESDIHMCFAQTKAVLFQPDFVGKEHDCRHWWVSCWRSNWQRAGVVEASIQGAAERAVSTQIQRYFPYLIYSGDRKKQREQSLEIVGRWLG
jgi:hypothetical protein